MAAKKRKKNVVVLGGGTGTFTVLTGLKNYPLNLTAVVAMADDGGSTGILRDELGVLPPGDVRQCLVALSSHDKLMRSLMNYRFVEGGLKGHSFGNLLLSALEKITGSFDEAVEKASEILRIEGRVVPATLEKVVLVARVGNRVIRGQNAIDETNINGALKKISLEPHPHANPEALRAIKNADAIVIGPGNLYSSLVPNLLVKGIPEAIRKSKAKKILICNLMTRMDQMNKNSVAGFTREIESFIGGPLDAIIYNNKLAQNSLLTKYAKEHETPTLWSDLPEDRQTIGADLVARSLPSGQNKGDILVRSLIRHDTKKLAATIVSALTNPAKKK